MIAISALSYSLNEGETELELLWRVASDKEVKQMTWDDIAIIMNDITNKHKSESAWRKRYTAMKKVIEHEKTDSLNTKESSIETKPIDEGQGATEMQSPVSLDNNTVKLNEKMRELERKRIFYRDERNAWQKQNYVDARFEETLEILQTKFESMGRIMFPELPQKTKTTSENEMIIMLSDLHIGQTFKNVFGEYNSDIAVTRINRYLSKIKQVAKTHGICKAHIVGLGDLVSGNIHSSIAITNKENVIEQIKKATELISSFCYECCQIFDSVHFYNVSGNHSRITPKKDEALHSERNDELVGWMVSCILSHVGNFHYMEHRKLDIGIADINAAGKTYIAVHGDYDPMTKAGISNLSMMLGFIPYAVLRGHMHYSATTELNGVKAIQAGSLAGSGDDHTIESRLTGKPSQTLLICNSKGIDCIYNVEM